MISPFGYASGYPALVRTTTIELSFLKFTFLEAFLHWRIESVMELSRQQARAE